MTVARSGLHDGTWMTAACLTLLAVVPLGAQSGRPAGSFARGPLTLELTDSTFRATLGEQLGAAGRLGWRGDTVTVRDTEGPRACARDLAGRYLARRQADTLRLQLIEDPCAGRRGVFSGGPFVAGVGGRLRVLEGATLIDGTGSPARRNVSVAIRNGRIEDVFETGARALPPGTETVDLRGRWLIPGLIDAHVHLGTDPSGSDGAAVTGQLRRALRGGLTTVRDMAGDARVLAGLARATRVGDLEGPDVYYSAIWAGADFMTDPRVRSSTRGTRPGVEPWMLAVSDSTDWRIAAAEARGSGARGIKLYADVSRADVGRAAAAAHDRGLRVWAHATLFPARPSDLVAAGVDVLSHAPLLAWEAVDALPDYRARYAAPFDRVSPAAPAIDALLRRMAERGTLFEPTLFVFSGEERNRQVADWAVAVTRRASAAGVAIVAGTDGMLGEGTDAPPNLHRELELLVGAGLTPLEAIQAGTLNAARALGIAREAGAIRPGLAADLVVLGADPLADIRNTRHIERVFKRGTEVRR
jgi:imidazolonepropionase-like amidohydrolase